MEKGKGWGRGMERGQAPGLPLKGLSGTAKAVAARLGGDGGGPGSQVCQALWDAHGMVPGQSSASPAHTPLQPGSGTGTCPLDLGTAVVSASQLHFLHQGWCSLVPLAATSQDTRAAPACSVARP